MRLEMIDDYLKGVIADPSKRKRVPYAAQPGLRNSAPIARHQIPRVVLPAPSPKTVPPVSEVGADTHVTEDEAKRQAVLDRTAKARIAKAEKKAQKS